VELTYKDQYGTSEVMTMAEFKNYDHRHVSDFYLTLNLEGPQWDFELEQYIWSVTLIEFSKDPVHHPQTPAEVAAYMDNIELRSQSSKYHVNKKYKTLRAAQNAFNKLFEKHFKHWVTNDLDDMSDLISYRLVEVEASQKDDSELD
jgi:hypothetical protein